MNARWMMMAAVFVAACDDPSFDRTGPGEEPNAEGPASPSANPPFQQNEQSGDLQTTAAVRRAILDAPDLGTGADNTVITTEAGVVTLRGNVESQAEKERVETVARGVPGVARIDNQLMVGTTDDNTEPDGAQTPNPR